MENKDFLINEIEMLINNLNEYREAMEKSDMDELIRILDEGRIRKEEVDG